ncbi:MAG: GlsB/YeaQ/YmgE family stress response membrane protein [Candidatus Tectimicrobiota bacterium]
MGIIGWILFGLVVGAIAKLLMPGRDPGGWIVTILLGIAGAVMGGFVGREVGWYGPNDTAGFLMALLGSIVLLALYRLTWRRHA